MSTKLNGELVTVAEALERIARSISAPNDENTVASGLLYIGIGLGRGLESIATSIDSLAEAAENIAAGLNTIAAKIPGGGQS